MSKQPQLFRGVGVQALKKYPKPRRRKKTIFEATKPLTKEQKFWNRHKVIVREARPILDGRESLQIRGTYYNPDDGGGFVTPPITSWSYLHFDIRKDYEFAMQEAIDMGCGIAANEYGDGGYGWQLYELLDKTIIKWKGRKE
ncbi:MAG: hypothetical protein OCU12_08040 [Methanophagales archaeon]|nr:hypothetical protein [Methanophagales archaeon]